MDELSSTYGGFISLKDIPARMKQWKEQTEIKRQDMDRIRDEKAFEKRRIQEKQIRALRGKYRPAGLLGTGEPAKPDMSDQLGG